jgi:S-DNA-T family DNA segregation ATPase FtsK/SpoIIIE
MGNIVMEKHRLIGIIIFSIVIFIFMAWLFPDASGRLGKTIIDFLTLVFGIYLIPLFLFLIGISLLLIKKDYKPNILKALSFYFLSLLFLISIFIQIFNLQNYGKFVGRLSFSIYQYVGIGGYILLTLFFSFLGFLFYPSFDIFNKKKAVQKEEEIVLRKRKRNIEKVQTKEQAKSINISQKPAIKEFSIPLNILSYSAQKNDEENYEKVARSLEETLKSFKIEAKVKDWNIGPSVVRYNIAIPPGVRVSRILSLSNDLALALAVPSVRFEAPVPGESVIGVEIPRSKPVKVYLREILESDVFKKSVHPLTIALGKDLIGNIKVGNLAEMLHLLIAGTTGSGKSMFINSLILSLLYKNPPENLNLILIDPKRVELSMYNKLLGKYMRHKVVVEPKKAVYALRWAVSEMERRYEIFEKLEVRNIDEYKNLSQIEENLPYIVIIIDELNDLMMVAPKEIEDLICRIAQKARAAGMHLVVATQRPSTDVITGLIKANIPSRIAFAVSSQIDSRIILDDAGAEKLIGRGDMLFHPITSSHPIRLQAPYVEDKDIKNVVSYIVENFGNLNYDVINFEEKEEAEEKEFDGFEDPLLPKVIELLKGRKVISTSYIQRKFSIGYNRAARILDILEEKGYVASQGEGKPRRVLRGGDNIS